MLDGELDALAPTAQLVEVCAIGTRNVAQEMVVIGTNGQRLGIHRILKVAHEKELFAQFGATRTRLSRGLNIPHTVDEEADCVPVCPPEGPHSTEDFHTSLGIDFTTPEHSNTFSTRPDGVQVERLQGWDCTASGIFWPSVEYFSSRREPEVLGETPNTQGVKSASETKRLLELKRRLVSAFYRDLRVARQPGPRGPFARIQRFWERLNSDEQVLDVVPVGDAPDSGEEVILRENKAIPDDITSLAMARKLAPSRPDIPRMVPLDRLSSGLMAIFAFAGPAPRRVSRRRGACSGRTAFTLFALYRAPLNVWVEDPLSHSVLTELWKDPQINVVVTQGKPGVRHMVRSNPDPTRCCVYGIVDRDFDDDNEAQWASVGCQILHLPVHEFENLLLDFEALATLTKGTTATAIRDEAHDRAVKLHGWMPYKAILREMQQELGAGFPANIPSNSPLSTAADIAKLLRESVYWKEHAAALKRWVEPTKLDDRIRVWHQKLQSDLQGDAWLQTFSGKEIFRHLRSHVRGLDEAPTLVVSATLETRQAGHGISQPT